MNFAIPALSKLSPTAQKWLKAGGLLTGLSAVGYESYPFVLAGQHALLDKAAQSDSLSPELETQLTAQRRQNFENSIFNQYIRQGSGKIDWHQMADIIDFIAKNTPSDTAFRKDIWHLFGWREGHARAPLAQYLDSANTGLPSKLHNSAYQSEQMHHYLGSTTGNTDKIASHLQNNRIYAYVYELKELFKRGQYNWGDVRLFNVAQKHRNDFLRRGRSVVARNIRTMLLPKSVPSPLQNQGINYGLPAQILG